VSYQWFFGTDPIDGATNKSLSLTNIQPTQAGNYFVVASNTVGSATSSISALNVIFPIAIEMTPTVVIKFAGIYDIQRIDGFGLANDWTTLMRVVVTNPPQSFYDTSYVGKTNEFYRLLKMINPH